MEVKINIAVGGMSDPVKNISRNDISNLAWLLVWLREAMTDWDNNIQFEGWEQSGILKQWDVVTDKITGRKEFQIIIEVL